MSYNRDTAIFIPFLWCQENGICRTFDYVML
nr:MAG TPA: hypothetical protein [Caudoviricetes sp.]